MKKAVTVFCASSPEVSPIFFSEMEALASGLAKAGVAIVYGGANMGIMGHMADVALKHGGEVIGVIPQYFYDRGAAHDNLSELIIVGNLMDRKRKMAELGTHILAYPGGIGTMDEITEIMALKQVGELDKPILFHNFMDYWKPFFDYMIEMQQMRMIRQTFDEIFLSFDTAQEVVENITNG